MTDPKVRLRELLAGPTQLLVPEALSPALACMAQIAGFEAVFTPFPRAHSALRDGRASMSGSREMNTISLIT